MNQKVAIYCRLSEEDRNKRSETDDSESIQNQKTCSPSTRSRTVGTYTAFTATTTTRALTVTAPNSNV